MNDTEAEARHLLAVATEDIPPGIDLLDRFVAVRRRDRARRRRRRAVLSAGVAVTAATVAAVTLTIGSAMPARSAAPARSALVSALTRTLAQSYHYTASEVGIPKGRSTKDYHQTCTGETDPVRYLQAVSCSDGSRLREVGGGNQFGYAYSYVYTYAPGTPSFTRHPGRPWVEIKIPHEQYGSPFDTATPWMMLGYIKEFAKITVVGPASGPGWTGTRYAFSGPKGPTAIWRKFHGTMDVDQQGLARRFVVTMRNSEGFEVFTEIVTYSDFGARVTVTPPPPDRTWRSR
jgi:hypothetical protein